MKASYRPFIFLAALLITSSQVIAAGMLPETSVVLINAADGEGVINVTNSDPKAALLFTSLQNLPEDQEDFLLVTPPVARVDPGDRQLVRFILQTDTPITTQRLKRVSFEGIPQKNESDRATVGFTVRQDLPVLISPADLPIKQDPWTLLEWSVRGQQLVVKNDSRYVVRLSQEVTVPATNINLMLPKTYILPGQTHRLDLPEGNDLSGQPSVRIYPASTYGFAVAPYDAPLQKR